jgi:anti-sigma B factor antagonist
MATITIKQLMEDDIVILELTGYLDVWGASELEVLLERLVKEKHFKIVLDLGGIAHLSSAGLGVFMVFIEPMRRHNGDIKICNTIPKVYHVLDLLLPNFFEIYSSREDAINRFKAVEKSHTISEDLIMNALDNENYDWRTIEGIATECNLTQRHVEEILEKLQDEVIRSSVPDAKGRQLYTSRAHYKRSQSFLNKSLSALSDRIK